MSIRSKTCGFCAARNISARVAKQQLADALEREKDLKWLLAKLESQLEERSATLRLYEEATATLRESFSLEKGDLALACKLVGDWLKDYTPMVVTYDRGADVLYVRALGAALVSSVTYTDLDVVCNLDSKGEIRGAQLVSFSEMDWSSHPDRDKVPRDVLLAVDTWIEESRGV